MTETEGPVEALRIDVGEEIDRYFDDSSLAGTERPRFVLLAGAVCTGKTRLRREKYGTGYVVVDAPEIFIRLSRGRFFEFPSVLEEPMDLLGRLVADRAVRERRHIVTEITGADYEATKQLIDTMLEVGYQIQVVGLQHDPIEAWERNLARSDDNISAYYAEPYHRRWLLEAVKEKQPDGQQGGQLRAEAARLTGSVRRDG